MILKKVSGGSAEKSSGMKIEEAVVYVLARRGVGLKTDQIADIINRERLFVCRDGRPVSSAFVYRTVMTYPDTFVVAQGRIFLMI